MGKRGVRERRLREKRKQQRSARMQARRRRNLFIGLVVVSAWIVAALVYALTTTGGDDRASPIGGSPSPTVSASPACTVAGPETRGATTFPQPPCTAIDVTKRYLAHLETTRGPITLELDPALAPATVNNFVFLARAGFYDASFFSRVADVRHAEPATDYALVQGGDPVGDGSGGPGYTYEGELPPAGTRYMRGTVAMANSGTPSSNGSQFFIIVRDWEALSPDFTVFGTVVEEASYSTLDTMLEARGREIPGVPGVRPEPPIEVIRITIEETAP